MRPAFVVAALSLLASPLTVPAGRYDAVRDITITLSARDALLDQPVIFDLQTEVIVGAVNAVIGAALFRALDKLRVPE